MKNFFLGFVSCIFMVAVAIYWLAESGPQTTLAEQQEISEQLGKVVQEGVWRRAYVSSMELDAFCSAYQQRRIADMIISSGDSVDKNTLRDVERDWDQANKKLSVDIISQFLFNNPNVNTPQGYATLSELEGQFMKFNCQEGSDYSIEYKVLN